VSVAFRALARVQRCTRGQKGFVCHSSDSIRANAIALSDFCEFPSAKRICAAAHWLSAADLDGDVTYPYRNGRLANAQFIGNVLQRHVLQPQLSCAVLFFYLASVAHAPTIRMG
jgi:hypothetical protein